jgi:putative holliday junction resolvase
VSSSNSDFYELMALDIGDARIGVARAHSFAKMPEPMTVIPNDSQAIVAIVDMIHNNNVHKIIVGLPLNTQGVPTQQTQKVESFVATLRQHVTEEVIFVDESYTSKMADEAPSKEGALHGHNDADAACYILQRYFQEGATKNV